MFKKWWQDGIRFQCQGSGKCCISHGEYGHVFLTLKDRQKLANFLKVSTVAFTKKYCQRYDGYWCLKESPDLIECVFLKNKKCKVHSVKPTQCRTWPFWPESINPKSWSKDVVKFCPGIDRGPLFNEKQLDKILNEQIQSNKELLREKI